MPTLTALFLLLLLALYIAWNVQKVLLSPLRRIPAAHPTSPFSRLWILCQTLRTKRNAAVHEAHQKHGPIVRLGPNELSVNSATGIKKIFAGGFEKDTWYLIFQNYGTPPMFSLLPSSLHSSRKRLLAHTYSNTTVSTSPLLSVVSRRLLPHLLLQFKERDTEVHTLFNALTMDFITSFLFTLEYCSNFLPEARKSQREHFEKLYHSRRKYFPISSELPGLINIAHKLGIRLIPKWVDQANNEIEAWCAGMCRARESSLRHPGKSARDLECVYDRLYFSPQELSFEERASEMLDHIGAGHETTALSLSFTLQALSTSLSLQDQLREELAPNLFVTEDGWKLAKDYKSIERLPLLEKITKESLRLYSPIPGSQHRIVPSGGAEVEGYWLQAGTKVSSQPWSLHRAEDIWGDDAKEFRPERWESENKEEMERWWWAFGSGGRGCIGRWLAIYELKMTLAAVYANFETHLGEGMKSGEVRMEDRYTTAPGSDGVYIRFMRTA